MLLLSALWALFWLIPSALQAQQGEGITLEQIEQLLGARQSSQRILQIIQEREFCLSFQLDEASTQRLRAAGADDELITGLGRVAVCREVQQAEEEPPPPPPEERTRPSSSGAAPYSPSSAAVRSLAIPGLGQFYTGSPAAGGLFLAGWAGALGYGLMSQEVTVYCLAPATEGSCPAGQDRNEEVERPNLIIGVGAAAVIAVASALHARSAANKANAQGFGPGEDAKSAALSLHILPAGQPRRPTDMVLIQLRF